MSTTEAERLQLIDRARDTMGPEAAMTLANLLPPSGWADVARRQDLDELERRIDLRFEALQARFDARFESLEARFDARFVAVDAKLASIDERFRQVDERFRQVDERFDAMEASIDLKLDRLRFEVMAAISASASLIIRTVVFALIGTLLAAGTLAVGLAQFLGR